jgi:hypothetical protein
MRRIPLQIWACVTHFQKDVRGGVIMIAAFSFPAVALLVAGAIDLISVSSDRQAIQAAADSAALNLATQLKMSTAAGLQGRAQQLVGAQIPELAARYTYTVTATADNQAKNITVVVDGTRQSFFMNLLPPGGWHLRAQTVAQSMGQVPLCVLSAGSSANDKFIMGNTAKMTANGCLIQSDSDIAVTSSAALSAAAVQAVGAASGPITPAAQVGAANVPDPFASMKITIPTLCSTTSMNIQGGAFSLPPGVHCGNVIVGLDGILTLAPGEHYFILGKLYLKLNSKLTGTDVVMVFDGTSNFQFQDQASITLEGRKSGPLAGFVAATTTANTSTFEISSDNAKELLGTIYVPSAKLLVTGAGNSVNASAAWTVIVAKSIELSGSPNLVINSNYAGSSVPVPDGVGPSTVKGTKIVN